jgi:two-component system, NarL family, sensor kinase
MNLERLRSETIKFNPEAEAVIDDTASLVDEMSRQLRTMSYLLHPPLLDEVGLGSALKWYVEGFAARSSIQVSLELPSELGRLPPQMEITIFRLIQESLTNIHRHSGSKTALIRITRDVQSVRLEIVDRGNGFNPHALVNEPHTRPGVGILGMKERVRRFGGTLEFLSSHDGTTIQAKLPISAEWDHAQTAS